MKNRTYGRHKNGKIFCWHRYVPGGMVGPDWDITVGVSVPVVCAKCGRRTELSSIWFREWPDDLIDRTLRY